MIRKLLRWIKNLFRKPYKPPPPGSTFIDIRGPQEFKEKAAETVTKDHSAVQKFMCTYFIPDAKLPAMEAYIKAMRKKYPHITSDRIFRKTAEYFNLEKLPNLKEQSS